MSNVSFSQSGHVEVPNVSVHTPDFQSRFPFAYFVQHVLQDARPIVESFGGSADVLEKQIEQTLPMLSATTWDADRTEAVAKLPMHYLHDYVAITSVHIHLTVDQQVSVWESFLRKCFGWAGCLFDPSSPPVCLLACFAAHACVAVAVAVAVFILFVHAYVPRV